MKKSQLFLAFVSFTAVFLFPRCGITLYVPNTVNSPLLGEKGDYRFNAGFVTQAPEITVDVQGAYGITNHFGILANTSFMSGNDDYNSEKNSHVLLEAAAGAFTPFGMTDADWKMGRLEIYGGYGVGWAEDNENGYQYKGNYNRFFIQPAIGLRQKVVDFSFSPRMAFINYSNYKSTDPNDLVDASLGFTTFEPTATVSLGYKKGRVYLQLSRVLLMSGRSDYERVTLFDGGEELNFNIGGTFCTWKQKEVERPPVSLRPEKEENKSDRGLERTGKPEPAPASIAIAGTDFSICVKEGGEPDGDTISLTFNGVYLARELELTKEPACFDVAVTPGQEGLLRITTLSEGIFTPNTLQILIRQGKKEKVFYLRTEKDKIEEIKFKQE